LRSGDDRIEKDCNNNFHVEVIVFSGMSWSGCYDGKIVIEVFDEVFCRIHLMRNEIG
jgi:hypothetical protein